jgi:lipopolysaccharide/colanic/teichoic acid biosynthesis glycosyltransferase
MTNGKSQASKYSLSLQKRILDIILASFALLTLSPLVLIIALLIKSKSKGPVIFKQKRVGLNGKLFTIYKFRTMRSNAHKLQDKYKHLNISPFPTFKIPNDPRFTPFGLFLSKTTLDELPQLINVLKGDMSIVAPRPFPENEHNLLPKDWQPRIYVKPGLVSKVFVYPRNNMTTTLWTKIDLDYVQNANLLMDLKMILIVIYYYIKIISYQIRKQIVG